jgi:hypothetical protein
MTLEAVVLESVTIRAGVQHANPWAKWGFTVAFGPKVVLRDMNISGSGACPVGNWAVLVSEHVAILHFMQQNREIPEDLGETSSP